MSKIRREKIIQPFLKKQTAHCQDVSVGTVWTTQPCAEHKRMVFTLTYKSTVKL